MQKHEITVTTKTSTRIGERRPAVEVSCTCWNSKEFKTFDQEQNLADAQTWRDAHRVATSK